MAWICDKNGNRKCEIKRLSYNGTFMEVSSITVTVESPTPIDFAIGDYIDWDYDGLRYSLDTAAGVEKQARRNTIGKAFVYENLVFLSPLQAANNVDFLDVVIGNTVDFMTNTEFSFYGTAWDYAKRLEANLCRLDGEGAWKVRIWTNGVCYDTAPAVSIDTGAWENKLVEVSKIKCLGGFQQIYDLWGCAYVFSVENGVNYVDFYDDFEQYAKAWKQGGVDKIFAYGKGNGLYKIRHTPDADHLLVTRLRAYGSSENLPANYYLNSPLYHVDGNESSELAIANLMLPASEWTKDGVKAPVNAYLEQNTDLYGVREASVAWDGSDEEFGEIKPSIYGLTIQDLLDLMSPGDSYRPIVAKWPDTSQRIDKIITGAAPADNGAVAESGYDFTVVEARGVFSTNELSAARVYNIVDFGDLTMATIPSVGHLADYRVVPTSENVKVASFDVPASVIGLITDVNAYITPYVNGVKVDDATIPCIVSSEVISREVSGVEYTKRYYIHLLDANSAAVVFSTMRTGAVTFKIQANITYSGQANQVTVLRNEYAVNFNLLRGNKAIDKFFSVIIPQIGFDLSAAMTGSAKLCMRSGYNQPREFPIVASSVRYDSATDTWYLRCKRVVDQSTKTYFPNSDAVIATGDEYYFSGIAMPALYVEIAARKLLKAAKAWLKLHSKPRMLSSVDVDNKIMAVEGIVLREGMSLPLNDADLAISPETQESRIIDNIRIEEGENAIRTFSITLRDKKEKSSIDSAIRGATSGLATSASVSEAVSAAESRDHGALTGRDMPNQHPISAITGLEDALASKTFFEEDGEGGVKLKDHYAGLWTKGFVTAGGIGSGGGGGGGGGIVDAIRRYSELGGTFSDGANDVFNAYTVNQLHLRIQALEQHPGGVESIAGLTGVILRGQLNNVIATDSVTSGNDFLVTSGGVYSYVNTVLSSAIKFKGETTTQLVDGGTNPSIVVNGQSYTAVAGDVVVDTRGFEFLWTGSNWRKLGDDTSYALKTISITGTGYLSGGGTLERNRTINLSQAAQTKLEAGATVAGYFSNGVLGSSHLPNMYVGRTQVIFSADNTTLLGVNAISNLGSSGSTDKSRIEWDGSAWHFYGNIYADGYISAGGVGSGGGGGGGIDLDRVWESLTNNTDKPNVKINVAHIPNLEISNINGLSAALADAGKVKKVQVGSGNPVEPDLNGIIKLPAYLQLSGGTMTGGITMPSGGSSVSNTKGLMFTDNCSITTSTNNNMAIRSQRTVYITSYYGMDNQKAITLDGDTFTYGGQTIYHAGNLTVGVLTGLLGNTYHPYLGSSSLAFTARTLTITADAAIAHIAFQRASANYITAPENGSLNFIIGKSSIGTSLATLRLGSDNVTVNGYGAPGVLNIFNTASNQDAGSIFFGALNGTRNGFKISSVYSANACRQSLVFYRSDNGSDPYTFTPVELMRLTHNGRVGIKNSDPAYVLDVSGVTRVTSLKIGDGAPELSWDAAKNAWKLTGNLYATGFISAGGIGSGGGGGGGADLLDVWVSLRDNYTTDEYYNWKVNAGHIPLGTGFTIDSAGRINVASASPSEITLTGVVTGSGTTVIGTSIADGVLSIAKTNGLQAALDGKVSNVTYSSEQLHVTKGGNTTDLTIAFATYTRRLKRFNGTSEAGGYDLNTLIDGGGITSQYTSTGYWANAPAGMSYGSALEINNGAASLSAQVAWDINHNSETPTRRMWWRAKSSSHGWQGDWHLIYDSSTLTKSVITGLLGTEYHPYLGNTSLDFSAKALTLNGALTGATTGNFSSVLTADRLVLTSSTQAAHIAFGRTDAANYITAPTGGTIAFVPNGLNAGSAGIILWVATDSVIVKGPSLSTPGVLKITNNTSNAADAGEILFQSYTGAYSPDTTPKNGFRIAAEGASYCRQSLNFYSSDNREGDYSPIWKRAMRISYTGNVVIGNTTDGSEFFPTLYSYGDLQVGYASNAATMKVFGRSTLAGGIAIGTSTNAQSDYLEWDEQNRAWHLKGNLYADGFITAGGVGAGGQEEGATLLTVWRSLTNNPYLVDSDITATTKIAAAHIPVGSGLQISDGVINAIGQVESVVGLTGEINQSQLRTALGLGSLAYRNNITKSYITDFPTAVSAFTNDAGYITGITLTGVVTGSGTTSINTSIADNALTIAKTNGLQAALDGRVSNVTYSNEQLHVTKGGNTTDLTIAFATYTRRLKRFNGTSESGGYDLNTLLDGGGITSQYSSTSYWANAPTGMSYAGAAMEIATGTTSLSAQVAWDINHNSETPTRRMWWRAKSSSHGWQNDWHLIYDSSTLTKAVITGLLGNEYHPYGGTTAIDFSAKALTLNGALTGGTTGEFSSTLTARTLVLTADAAVAHIAFGRAGANYITVPENGSLNFVIGKSSIGTQMSTLRIESDKVTVNGYGAPGVLKIFNSNGNSSAGDIIFQCRSGYEQNGFKISAEATGSYQNQTLNFYCSDNRNGDYSPIWQRAMRISYTGNVVIGNSTSGSEFYPTLYSYGNFQVGLSGNAATMDVYGAATLRSTLGVTGATTLNDTLSVAGAITLTGTSSSTAVINFSRAGANYITTPESGTLNIVTNGRTKTIANSTLIVGVDDVTVQGATMTVQGVGAPGVLNIFNNTNNQDAGSIFFSSYNRNGFKISSVCSANACRQSLVFYRSDNTTSPYEFTPIELMRLTNDGKVGIKNDTPAYDLDVTGTVRATALRLGDGSPEMVWDGTNNAWRLKGNFYADGFVSAGGMGNPDNSVFVTLTGTQTITGAKTFSGTATFTGAIRLRNTVTIGTSSTARAVTLYGTLSVSSSLTAGAVSIVDDGGYPLISSANTRLYLQDSQDLVLTSGAHTVIGSYVTPGSYKLYVNGIANATRWDTSSDCRLKKDRVAIDNVWDVLLKLQPKEWIWNSNSNLDGQKGAGLIAQEVEPVLPFAVHGTDYKTLDYTAFHAYEIAGLQDHESRIKALEKENKELKEKVKQLEMR